MRCKPTTLREDDLSRLHPALPPYARVHVEDPFRNTLSVEGRTPDDVQALGVGYIPEGRYDLEGPA